MTTKDDDLYSRHQTLAALVNVLLHDLRNPLHSATLLIEAMGSPTADIDTLRGKLRMQFAKLEALMGEASGSIKEMALEARIETVGIDALLRSTVELYPTLGGADATFVLPAATELRASVDPTLLSRAIMEIAAAIASQGPRERAPVAATVVLTVDQPDADTVRLRVGDLQAGQSDAMIKAPFAIASGGIRLAVARALSQNAGAPLRLEPQPEGTSRFAFLLRRAS